MAGRSSRSFILLNFKSRNGWLAADAKISSSTAIRFPVHSWSRRATIRPRMCSGILLCDLWGSGGPVLKAGHQPPRPGNVQSTYGQSSWRLRRRERAVAFTVVPSWSTRRTSSSRLYGVTGILVGVHSALLGVGSFGKCQHSRSGPNGQQPICSSHLDKSRFHPCDLALSFYVIRPKKRWPIRICVRSSQSANCCRRLACISHHSISPS